MLLGGAGTVLYVSSDVLLHLDTEVLKNLSVVMYEVWTALYKGIDVDLGVPSVLPPFHGCL